jgi:methionine-rich copper-binding protein CopC
MFALAVLVSVVPQSVSPINDASAAVSTGNTVFVGCLSSGIKRTAIDGTSGVENVSAIYGLYLAARNGWVYSSGNSGIRRVRTDGTGEAELFSGSGQFASYLYGVDVDDNYIYFGNDYDKRIGRANLDGTGVNYDWVNLASSLNFAASDMARAGNYLFFGQGGNVNGRNIGRVNIDGTSPVTIATDSDSGVAGVAADDSFVYWIDYHRGEVGRVSHDGSNANDDFITGLSFPWDIVATSTHLYVLEGTTVVRFALDGSGKTVIKATSCSRGIAIENSLWADSTAPTLLSSVPADNATGVSASANIVLNFSENVTAVSAKNIVIKKSSDNSTVETILVTDGSKVSVSGSQVTVNPSSMLDDSTGYYVTVESGAFKDAANNVYAGISSSTALNFTTAADTTAPTLSSSVPADNATGVSASSNIVVNFSENVTAVSAKNIVIKKSSDDSTVETISVTDGSKVSVLGSQVTVNPSSTLDDSTGYYVTVESGAFKDAANNVYAGISSSTALNFTTAAAVTAPTTTAPLVTTVTNPGSTDTTVPTSILSGRSTTTTVVARVAPTVTPTTTTTIAPTTTTSTTVADDDVPAPPAPDVAIGEAAALVNGQSVKLSISRENNILTVAGSGITMTVAAVLDDGTIAPLDTDGNVRLDDTRLLQLTLFGVAIGSDTEVWIYSNPVRLGVFAPDAEGSISARLVVPDEVEGGEHRFVVKSRAQSGDDETLALGIVVGASSEGVQFEWLIGIPLTLAVAAALIIPATRRRRRAAAEV